MFRIRTSGRDFYNSLLLSLWLFAEYRYFNIPSDLVHPLVRFNTMSVHYVKISVLLIIIVMNYKKIQSKEWYHKSGVELLVASFTVSAISSIVNYGYAVKTIERFINLLYLPILYVALLAVLNTKKELKRFIILLTVFNILSVSLYSIQAVVYNNRGNLFLTFRWEQNTISKRNGYIRIIECLNMTLVSFAVSTSIVLSKIASKPIIHFVNLVISGYYLVFVSMTRIIFFIAGVIFAIAFMIMYKPPQKTALVLKWIIIISSCILLVFVGTREITEYIELVKTENSYISRIGAFKYYGSQIYSCLISGILFVDFTGSDYFSIAHGPVGRYYTSDIGAFGIIINYGMITFIVYMFIIVRFIRKKKSNSILDFILALYMILTIPTQSQIDLQRLGVFGVVLALSDSSERIMRTIEIR